MPIGAGRGGTRWLAGTSLATLLAAAPACGGSEGGTEPDAGVHDAGSDEITPTFDLGDAATPCDRALARRYSCVPTLPAAEILRLRDRFARMCQGQMALPGSGMTATSIVRCQSAQDALLNVWYGSPECDVRGSLAAGAPCNEGFQCQGGACNEVFYHDGYEEAVPVACGTCGAVAGVGASCHQPGGCVAGSTCLRDPSSDVRKPVYTCLAYTEGAAGAPCDGLSATCTPGLFCDPDASTCSAPSQVGESCKSRLCTPPLHCFGSQEVCEPPSPAGAPCGEDCDCVAGLGCNRGVCGRVSWLAPGATCLPDDRRRCLVGSCAFSRSVFVPPPPPPDGGALSGICPHVVADREPCDTRDGLSTCDTFSQCFRGTCVLTDSVVCDGQGPAAAEPARPPRQTGISY